MCHIAGKVSGICLFQFLSIVLIWDFRSILKSLSHWHVLTCDCEILNGLLCLVCEVHCKILHGLLGLLCEKCELFSLFVFDKVFINWGTCFAITRLLRQLLICLVYMPMRIFASFFWLHWLWNIFLLLWCICFHIAIAYRFHMRDLNMHMASIHGDGIGLQFIFLLLCTKCSGQEFLDSQALIYSFHICGCVCFCSSN